VYVYTALGDSITYGQNATSTEKTYTSRLISMLRARGVHASSSVVARPGWTSADLAGAVNVGSDRLRYATTISVWIGGVDLILSGIQILQGSGNAMERVIVQYERNLSAILRRIRAITPCGVVCCTQYNPYPNSAIAVKGISLLNQAIIAAAAKQRCGIARSDLWFAGNERRLIDGYRNGFIEEVYHGFTAVHPNDNGHGVIASGLFPFLLSGM
jgi:lysophospholipase L1-like esterase